MYFIANANLREFVRFFFCLKTILCFLAHQSSEEDYSDINVSHYRNKTLQALFYKARLSNIMLRH